MQVLYVTGSGRSGSTLFERILHSADGIVGLGELHCLWRLPLDELTCSCGHSVAEDPFWAEVLQVAGVGPTELARLAEIERGFVRTGTIVRARLSLARLSANPRLQEYLQLQRRIYEAVAEVSGAGTALLVDSSKAGPRAWMSAADADVTICHISRDPTDVLMSWRSKKFDKGLRGYMARPTTSMAAIDWVKVELLARALGRHRRVLSVDYEHLAREPKKCIDEFLVEIGHDDRSSVSWSTDTTFIPGSGYHSVNGNPDRFHVGEVAISFRRVGRSELSLGDWLSCQLVGRSLRSVFSRQRTATRTRSRSAHSATEGRQRPTMSGADSIDLLARERHVDRLR